VRLWQCWDKNFKISKKSPFLGEKTMLKVGSFLLGGGWSGNAWNRHKTVSLAIYLRERKNHFRCSDAPWQLRTQFGGCIQQQRKWYS
jgi:hypothetical protein